MRWLVLLTAVLALALPARSQTPGLSANEIVKNVLDSDPWGLTGAEIRAHAILTDKRGATRELSFTAISRRYQGQLSKSVVRFSAPPDLAGAGFLQVQNRDGDDDRYLFLPALGGGSRRISGSVRSSAFMGTDFSFADLDRRDLRDSQARSLGVEKIGSSTCYVVDVVPRRSDTQYSHTEMWVRTDNFLPLRMRMYDLSRVLIKTFEAQEIRRIRGSWFVSKSLMTDLKNKHTTQLVLQSITVNTHIPDEEFSVRALERP